jgi:hypothetical protein
MVVFERERLLSLKKNAMTPKPKILDARTLKAAIYVLSPYRTI